ncbi:H-NS histone family protein [Pseudooceanicola sp. 216_PA32_1]|uniref:H-NS histone family protein n=1 Tax=Pseudooceanicola pacificus TaxID=2676438 RepID=A0A844WCA6_9RHOB|nr:H-NS histone family protein [Pseudooceanicola pacificus]MWB78963.1 H-NS histone family protein [Pseudooceanicola pacificus]
MSIDLESKSLDELRKLRKDVDVAIKTYQDRERKKALAAVEQKALEMGFSLSELTGQSSKSRKVNPPKYRDPADPTQTWSGRGRQPGWVKQLLDEGKSLDDYLIK